MSKINEVMEEESPEQIMMIDGVKKSIREIVNDIVEKKKREFSEG